MVEVGWVGVEVWYGLGGGWKCEALIFLNAVLVNVSVIDSEQS